MSIDTYADRADAATGYRPTPSTFPDISEDPRYFNYQLYSTMIARNVAEAKWRLNFHMTPIVNAHKLEMRNGIPMGCECSRFQDDGKLKPQFRSPL
jgi:hypothetical protein